MEIAQLEQEKQIAVRNVIMSEKMVEQAKEVVARLEGRIFERKAMLEEAEAKKKEAKEKPQANKQMAQEWETEILLIKSVEERKGRTSGNTFWVIATDKGEYTLFEPTVFDEVARNQGNKCELKTFRDETHTNIKGFVKVVEVGNAPAKASEEPKEAKRKDVWDGTASQLVSYAKDLVCSSNEESMDKAIVSVIAAYKKASAELQMVKVRNSSGHDLVIAWGTSIENLEIGRLSTGELTELDIEPSDFVQIFQSMVKKKVQQQAAPVDEWTVKEWEVAYDQKCREIEKLKGHMRIALQNLTKAIQMELDLKVSSWKNIFDCIRDSEIKSKGGFWAAIQSLEVQLEIKAQMEEPIENTKEETHEQKSSVEVSKNSRGYNYKVKVYDDDADKAFEKMVELEAKCATKYGG